jgi:hypothetical protein
LGGFVRQIINTPGTDDRRGPGQSGFRALARSRGAIIAAVIFVAGGLAAVVFLTGGNGSAPNPAAAAGNSSTGATGHNGVNSSSAGKQPSLAASPHTAALPKPAAHHTAKTKPTPKPSAKHTTAPSPSAHATPTPSASSASPSPTATQPVTGSSTCTHPQFSSSDPQGIWNLSPYFIDNDMWNVSGYNVSQTIYACSYSNFYAVATMNNDNGDGAVKTYPDSHEDFDNNPQINSFHSITSTFAESGPGTGMYEDAYDIWLNGVATSGSTEVMIWNDTHDRSVGGAPQATVSFGGHTYGVWRVGGGYVAFVAESNFTSGSMNLLQFFKWLMTQGWIPSSSTLGAIDYGVELVSTNNVPETFSFWNFGVSTS